jgi:hypothetical protein
LLKIALADGKATHLPISARGSGDRLPTPEEIERLIRQRRTSRLGVWPPLLALRDAEPGTEWIAVAQAIRALGPESGT